MNFTYRRLVFCSERGIGPLAEEASHERPGCHHILQFCTTDIVGHDLRKWRQKNQRHDRQAPNASHHRCTLSTRKFVPAMPSGERGVLKSVHLLIERSVKFDPARVKRQRTTPAEKAHHRIFPKPAGGNFRRRTPIAAKPNRASRIQSMRRRMGNESHRLSGNQCSMLEPAEVLKWLHPRTGARPFQARNKYDHVAQDPIAASCMFSSQCFQHN